MTIDDQRIEATAKWLCERDERYGWGNSAPWLELPEYGREARREEATALLQAVEVLPVPDAR